MILTMNQIFHMLNQTMKKLIMILLQVQVFKMFEEKEVVSAEDQDLLSELEEEQEAKLRLIFKKKNKRIIIIIIPIFLFLIIINIVKHFSYLL